MAIEQKERYIATLEDGRQVNVLAATFSEVIMMLGEENLVKIEKLPYDEVAE